jgi:hypothetical protein
MNRRVALKSAAALSVTAIPAALLASTKKQTPKIARTTWWSGWYGDLKVYTELTLVPSPEALADLIRQHPHMARWDTVQIGGQLLVLEPCSSSMKRIDEEDVLRRLKEAKDGCHAAREAGDTEAEKRHKSIVKAILHC